MFRNRAYYWSNTNFAKWVRQVFGAPAKPHAETSKGWREWKKHSKSVAPRIHWFTEKFLNKAQNFVNYPLDVLHEIRYYIKNRFFDKMHYLPTRLKKGQYYDFDTRLMHGMFEGLVDYVEVEKAHMQLMWDPECHPDSNLPKRPWRYHFPILRWTSFRSRELGLKYLEWETTLGEEPQAVVAREIVALYTWWKETRPNRPDPYDVSGWSEYCKNNDIFDTEPDERKDNGEKQRHKLFEIEQQYTNEDEEMMIRLIKIRQSLWT